MPRSVYVPGLGHGTNPVPPAARRGPLLMTGGVRGVDRVTGVLPADGREQTRLAFANLQALVEAGGGTVDDLVHVTVFTAEDGLRPAVNDEWVAMFPAQDARPARHVLAQDLPGGMKVQLEAVAWIEERS